MALRQAISLAPADPAPLIHLSRTLLKLNQPEDARRIAQQAAFLAPSLPEAIHAVCLAELAALWTRSNVTSGETATAWLALGRACLGLDKVLDARAAFYEAVTLQPHYPTAEAELALMDHLCGRPLAAMTRLQAVLERDPDCLIARISLGSRLLLDGDARSTLMLLDHVVPTADEPLRPHWQAQRAQALVALGRDEDAWTAITEAARVPSRDLDLTLTWQRCLLARRAGHREAATLADRVAELSRRRGSGTLEQRVDAQFDLAELREAEGKNTAAFEHWRYGHALLRSAQPFSRDNHDTYLTSVMQNFHPQRLAEGPRAVVNDPTPVFIVGLPRTGTTLLEQILDAHPMVHGAGERLAIRETLARLTNIDGAAEAMAHVTALDTETLSTASHRYLAELHALAPDAARVLDKMPDNVFQLGFIATLLPGARIICCTRDLRDVGASIFRHRFLGHHPYAHDLADLGWYMARQQRLVAHWQRTLPLRMLLLDHGEWITDFASTLRRVLRFLDLPYDAACERFFERGRQVSTASRMQVRQPINAAGVGRWHVYAEQLAPMLRELPAAIAHDGAAPGRQELKT